jgi:putative transcriptional regulator
MMNINGNLGTREFKGMKPRIQDIRKEKGLMQKFIADKLGISQQQLSDWENKKAYPRIDRAYQLAELLGVDVNELYEEE